MGVSVFEDCDSLKAINLLTSSNFALPSYTFPVDLRELYLPFDLPADYDVEFTAQSVYVPLGCKAGYVANIQKNNPDYTGENVKELDFDARSFAINAAEGYGTYYTDRPFVMPEGVEGGVVTPGDAEGVMRVDYRYAAGDVVPAGVGLVLKGEPGTYAYESKYFYEAPAAPTENLLSGTVQQTVLPEDESVAYYMLSYDREGADLVFLPQKKDADQAQKARELPFFLGRKEAFGGVLEVGEGDFGAGEPPFLRGEQTTGEQPKACGRVLYVDLAAIPEGAVWRTRREGDAFLPCGGHQKSLKKFLTEKKIPARVGRELPVLAEGSEVLCIAGVELSDRIKRTQETVRAGHITFTKS